MSNPSLNAKFSSPEWSKCEKALLDHYNGRCQECGSAVGVTIHICFWEENKDPWHFPEYAYKCLCSEHRNRRKSLEREMRRFLAFFSTDEIEPLLNALEVLSQITENRQTAMEFLYPFAKEQRRLRSSPDMD